MYREISDLTLAAAGEEGAHRREERSRVGEGPADAPEGGLRRSGPEGVVVVEFRDRGPYGPEEALAAKHVPGPPLDVRGDAQWDDGQLAVVIVRAGDPQAVRLHVLEDAPGERDRAASFAAEASLQTHEVAAPEAGGRLPTRARVPRGTAPALGGSRTRRAVPCRRGPRRAARARRASPEGRRRGPRRGASSASPPARDRRGWRRRSGCTSSSGASRASARSRAGGRRPGAPRQGRHGSRPGAGRRSGPREPGSAPRTRAPGGGRGRAGAFAWAVPLARARAGS